MAPYVDPARRRMLVKMSFGAMVVGAVYGMKADRRLLSIDERQNHQEGIGTEAANVLARELLVGSDKRFHEMFRMTQPCFRGIVAWLRDNTELEDTRYLCAEVKVMIFLWICAHNETQRNTANRFFLAQSSVSRIVAILLPMMRKFHKRFVQPKPDLWLDPKYELDQKLAWFNGCIGAIDGTHLAVFVPHEKQKTFRGRKSIPTQNVFAAVRSDQSFSFVMAGAEGAMQDSRLMREAFSRGFRVPRDRFYLGDSGFGTRPGILIPFTGVRYHLEDWRSAVNPPETSKELYNLRHARVRVVVEQAFGRLKRMWKIVRVSAPEYTLRSQINFVYAVTGLHNYILQWEAELAEEQEAAENAGDLEWEQECQADLEVLSNARKWAIKRIRGLHSHTLRCDSAIGMWKEYEGIRRATRRFRRR